MSSNRLDTYSNVFDTLQNIYLDTKIMKIGQQDGILSPLMHQTGIGSHLGGHLGFLELPKDLRLLLAWDVFLGCQGCRIN